MKQIRAKVFVASDGKRFVSEEECLKHEVRDDLYKLVNDTLYDDGRIKIDDIVDFIFDCRGEICDIIMQNKIPHLKG